MIDLTDRDMAPHGIWKPYISEREKQIHQQGDEVLKLLKQKHMSYYSIKSIDEVSESGIDFDFYRELFPEQDVNDDDWESPECISSDQSNDSYPIQIDKLIGHLESLKEKGANYAALYYHEDHIGYEIEGLSIYKSTPEEVYKHQNPERNPKKERIYELEAELYKLKAGL